MSRVVSAAPASSAAAPAPGTLVPASRLKPVGRWNVEQVRNAAIIVQVGRETGVPPRGWVVAVATAIQESTLRNLGNLGDRNDHDSLGLFQQRPSQGWGTPEQVTDPAHAARAFYQRLVRIPNFQQLRLSQAAQAVQRSAFPDAYQKWEGDAEQLVAAVANVKTVAVMGGGRPGAACGTTVLNAAAGWTIPVKGTVGSGFRTPDRPTHNGVDLLAARNTPIHAASSGKVIVSECNASTGTCDRDGGLQVKGCGWYVEILHTGNIVSRYCHMVRQPEVRVGQIVKAGQVLGFVGSSGNSSGPHLHFEIHTGVPANGGNAINPVPFMQKVGAPLGQRG